MAEKIKLSNDQELTCIAITRTTKDGNEVYRLFIPDWSQFIYNQQELLGNIQKRYGFTEEKEDLLALLIDYYTLNTTAPKAIKRTDNPLKKFTRRLSLSQLLYLEQINPEIYERDLKTKFQIRGYAESLSEMEQSAAYKKIKTKILKGFIGDESEPLSEEIKTGFSFDQPKNPFFYESDMSDFIESELTKVLHIRQYFLKKKDPMDVTETDYRYIRKMFTTDQFRKLLLDDEVIKSLKEKIDLKAEEIKAFEERVTNGIIQDDAVNTAIGIFISEIGEIYNGLLERLQEMKKHRKRSDLKSGINKMHEIIEKSSRGNSYEKLQSFIKLKNFFSDEDAARGYFLKEIEPLVKAMVRYSSKETLKLLIREQNLTKAEIRLFIMNNIGIKRLGYSIPLFEKPLLYFFNMDKYLISLFIDVVLNKRSSLNGQDAAWLLEMEFRIYLKFYHVFAEIKKISDSEDKKTSRYEKRIEEVGNIDAISLDSSLKESTAGIKTDKSENDACDQNCDTFENLDIDDLQSQLGKPEQDMESEDYEYKMKIRRKPDAAKHMTEFPPSLTRFVIQDVLSKICTEEEIDIIWKIYIENFTEEEIAREKGVSRQMVNKTKLNGLKKLARSKLFQRLYPL